jgi:hypothetical protein
MPEPVAAVLAAMRLRLTFSAPVLLTNNPPPELVVLLIIVQLVNVPG